MEFYRDSNVIQLQPVMSCRIMRQATERNRERRCSRGHVSTLYTFLWGRTLLTNHQRPREVLAAQ